MLNYLNNMNDEIYEPSFELALLKQLVNLHLQETDEYFHMGS